MAAHLPVQSRTAPQLSPSRGLAQARTTLPTSFRPWTTSAAQRAALLFACSAAPEPGRAAARRAHQESQGRRLAVAEGSTAGVREGISHRAAPSRGPRHSWAAEPCSGLARAGRPGSTVCPDGQRASYPESPGRQAGSAGAGFLVLLQRAGRLPAGRLVHRLRLAATGVQADSLCHEPGVDPAAEFVPYLLFGLLLGAVVDRFDRKRLMLGSGITGRS